MFSFYTEWPDKALSIYFLGKGPAVTGYRLIQNSRSHPVLRRKVPAIMIFCLRIRQMARVPNRPPFNLLDGLPKSGA